MMNKKISNKQAVLATLVVLLNVIGGDEHKDIVVPGSVVDDVMKNKKIIHTNFHEDGSLEMSVVKDEPRANHMHMGILINRNGGDFETLMTTCVIENYLADKDVKSITLSQDDLTNLVNNDGFYVPVSSGVKDEDDATMKFSYKKISKSKEA